MGLFPVCGSGRSCLTGPPTQDAGRGGHWRALMTRRSSETPACPGSYLTLAITDDHPRKGSTWKVVEWPRRGRWVTAETANRILVLYCRLPRPHLVAVGGSSMRTAD